MLSTEQSNAERSEFTHSRFLAVVLWVCAGAALWLLLSPAAFTRRDLTRRVAALGAEVQREELRNGGLARWRDGLQSDPSVIEREARKLGYGRPGERVYRLTEAELRAAQPLLRDGGRGGFSWTSAVAESVAPVLILLIAGVIAVLFFTDLRVEDPAAARQEPRGKPEEPL